MTRPCKSCTLFYQPTANAERRSSWAGVAVLLVVGIWLGTGAIAAADRPRSRNGNRAPATGTTTGQPTSTAATPTADPATGSQTRSESGAARLAQGELTVPTAATEPPAPVHFVCTEDFLNRLAARSQQETGPVRDFILGADVFGEQTTRSRVRVDLRPSPRTALAEFVLVGDGNQATEGVTPQATVRSVGTQSFEARKPVIYDGELLRTRAAKVAARATTQPVGAVTPFTGRPLLGPLAEQFSLQVATSRRTEAEEIARQRVADRVFKEFNTQVDDRLAEGNRGLLAGAERLAAAGLGPVQIGASSTDSHLHLQLRPNRELPGVITTPDPQLVENHAASIYIHESLMNLTFDRLNLGGRTVTDRQLRDLVLRLQPYLPDGARFEPPPPLPVETEIEIDADRPPRIELDRNRLSIVLDLRIRPAGQGVLPKLRLRIPFHAQLTDEDVILKADPVDVKVLEDNSGNFGFSSSLVEKLTAQTVQAQLEDRGFPRQLPAQYWQGEGPPPRITRLTAADGWLIIDVD